MGYQIWLINSGPSKIFWLRGFVFIYMKDFIDFDVDIFFLNKAAFACSEDRFFNQWSAGLKPNVTKVCKKWRYPWLAKWKWKKEGGRTTSLLISQSSLGRGCKLVTQQSDITRIKVQQWERELQKMLWYTMREVSWKTYMHTHITFI